MKRIVLLFSLMFLMMGTMFGQQDYVRKYKTCLVNGTPTFTPNKYRGCLEVFDTTTNTVFVYASGSWETGVTIATAGLTLPNTTTVEDINVNGDLYVDELVEFDSTLTMNGAMLVYGSLFYGRTLLNTVDDTLTDAGVVFISTYTTTGAHEINIGTDATLTGRIIFIQDGDGNATTNNITLTGIQSVTINGASSYVMNVDDEAVMLYAVGTDWRILGGYLE